MTPATIHALGAAREGARRLVPLAEIRGLYGYSERWWRYRTAEHGFPKHRWGGRLRFDPVEVERWLEDHYGAA